jgi:hypothetical protein
MKNVIKFIISVVVTIVILFALKLVAAHYSWSYSEILLQGIAVYIIYTWIRKEIE